MGNSSTSSLSSSPTIAGAVKDRSYVNKLFFPRNTSDASYTHASFPGELAWIPRDGDNPDGARGAIPVLALAGASARACLVILYTHGNGTDIGEMRDMLRSLADRCDAHVVAMEYPGYGISTTGGSASENRINRDLDIVFQYLTERLGWPAESIVPFGRSIGTGPAARLAVKERTGGLVLVSPYTSIRDMARKFAGKASWMVSDRFVTREELVKPGCPRTLVIHGTNDDLIPVEHAQRLMELRETVHGVDTQLLVPLEGYGHNDVFDEAALAAIVRNFNQFIGGGGGGRGGRGDEDQKGDERGGGGVGTAFDDGGGGRELGFSAAAFEPPASALTATGGATTSAGATILSQLFEMSGAVSENSVKASVGRS